MTRFARSSGFLLVAALAISLASSCSTKAEDDEALASCKLPSVIDSPSGLPADFPQLAGISLTEVQIKKKFVATEGLDDRSVEELFEEARPVLVDKGFDVINTDYEGFEAELYFAKGNSLAGIVSLREGPCDGYVRVNVLYDPLETPEGKEAVRKTRRLSGEG